MDHHDWIRSLLNEGAEKRERAEEKKRAAAEKDRLLTEFQAADRRQLAKMNDVELAHWQSQFPKESPQYIFGEFLWRNRQLKRSAKFTVLISTFTALLGAGIGYVAHGSQNVSKGYADCQTEKNSPPPVSGKKANPPQGATQTHGGAPKQN